MKRRRDPVRVTTIREVSAISIHSAERWNAQPREAMISIVGMGDPPAHLKRGWAETLRLVFNDIETPEPRRRLFGKRDADKIIAFLDRIEGRVDHVVVHCNRGENRAPAIARFITERYDLSNGFRIRPTFNRHIFETLTSRDRKGGRA